MSEESTDTGGIYFESSEEAETFSSGCQLFDCMLGGGWGENRVANLIGDSSSNKTGLAIEAAATFVMKYPSAKVYYAESEAAFDVPYAETLGLPTESVTFPEISTVEDVFKNLENEVMPLHKEEENKALYIIDSLDALSDEGEMERGIDENSYGATKAKKLSESFRRLTQKLAGTGVTVIVVSQVRDNMNAGAFAPKKTRSGGKALEFYCSQIVWLSRVEKINKTIKGEKRPIGTKIKAQCSKNKVGPPFREVTVPLYFSYGVDDLEANLTWLNQINKINRVSEKSGVKEAMKEIDKLPDEEFHQKREEVAEVVKQEWDDIEQQIAPRRSKYSRG